MSEVSFIAQGRNQRKESKVYHGHMRETLMQPPLQPRARAARHRLGLLGECWTKAGWVERLRRRASPCPQQQQRRHFRSFARRCSPPRAEACRPQAGSWQALRLSRTPGAVAGASARRAAAGATARGMWVIVASLRVQSLRGMGWEGRARARGVRG